MITNFTMKMHVQTFGLVLLRAWTQVVVRYSGVDPSDPVRFGTAGAAGCRYASLKMVSSVIVCDRWLGEKFS